MKTVEEELDEAMRQLESYRELATDQMDDDSFVARGNGFCDTKYSDDFLQMRIGQLEERIATLQRVGSGDLAVGSTRSHCCGNGKSVDNNRH